jgi:hypothetical protein
MKAQDEGDAAHTDPLPWPRRAALGSIVFGAASLANSHFASAEDAAQLAATKAYNGPTSYGFKVRHVMCAACMMHACAHE